MKNKFRSQGYEHLIIPFETKSIGEKTGIISGYGAAFKNVDHQKDVIVPGAFQKSLSEFKDAKSLPAMCLFHDDETVVGDWTDVHEDSSGLYTEGTIWIGKGMPDAEKAYCIANGTAKKGLSIGFRTIKADRDSKSGVRSLLEIKPLEISIVIYPANDKSTINSVKSLIKGDDGKLLSIRELEEILRETLGLSARETKSLLSQGYAGLCEDRDDASPDATSDLLKALSGLRNTLSTNQ